MRWSFARWLGAGAAVIASVLVVGRAGAQPSGQLPVVYQNAGIEEMLGDRLPLDVELVGENGEPLAFGSLLQSGRPVLLNFVYYDCPTLCSLLLDGLTRTLQQMEWTPGKEFDVVTVSFAANEGPDLAAAQREKFAGRLGPDAADGWRFLTGRAEAVHRLTRAAGFEFEWIENEQQYVHPATIMFVSPDGVLTRYLHGLEFQPRDVRNALVEASDGKVGTPLDQIILYCFRYDPATGSYVPYAVNIMKLGGLFTLIALGTLLFIFWRREHRRLDVAHAD